MLRDYRQLAALTKRKFDNIKEWFEITFDEEDKSNLRKLKDVNIVYNHSLQFNGENNHCIVPSQYVLYAICIKEFAIALRNHLNVFDIYKKGKDSNTIGHELVNKSFDLSDLDLDDYSKIIGLKPIIDNQYNLSAKSIVNGTPGKYKIRGTSDLFQSVILKIINVPDASSQILGKFIYELTSNVEVYNYLERKYLKLIPCIVQENVIKIFVKEVIEFLEQYDNLFVINKYLKKNSEKEFRSIKDEKISLTSIFKVGSSLLSEEELTHGAKIRYFKDPIGINKDREFIYLSTEWTSGKGSRLDLDSFKVFIEKHYNEFVIQEDNGIFSFLPRLQCLKTSNSNSLELLNYSSFRSSTLDAGLNFSDTLITRFISSLCTKPFVLLSGLSGSGKTKLAQCFAQWICEDDSQYKIVPVGADWTNREPLLGFPNALNSEEYIMPENGVLKLLIEANKSENSSKPYFLILDEMNLSHVERYFADFLSAMESNDCISLHSSDKYIIGVPKNDDDVNNVMVPNEICIPSNLFIIGTVNIDETTYMFSPKVLDRANTIEFRLDEEDMKGYLDNPTRPNLLNLKSAGQDMALDFLYKSRMTSNGAPKAKINEPLLAFFRELKKTGAEFGYRTAGEIYRLITKLGEINKDFESDEKLNMSLDIAIMQKLLPKVHGSRRKLEPILTALATFCMEDGRKETAIKFFDRKEENKYNENVKFSISLEKIVRMYNGAVDNGFASYAEA